MQYSRQRDIVTLTKELDARLRQAHNDPLAAAFWEHLRYGQLNPAQARLCLAIVRRTASEADPKYPIKPELRDQIYDHLNRVKESKLLADELAALDELAKLGTKGRSALPALISRYLWCDYNPALEPVIRPMLALDPELEFDKTGFWTKRRLRNLPTQGLAPLELALLRKAVERGDGKSGALFNPPEGMPPEEVVAESSKRVAEERIALGVRLQNYFFLAHPLEAQTTNLLNHLKQIKTLAQPLPPVMQQLLASLKPEGAQGVVDGTRCAKSLHIAIDALVLAERYTKDSRLLDSLWEIERVPRDFVPLTHKIIRPTNREEYHTDTINKLRKGLTPVESPFAHTISDLKEVAALALRYTRRVKQLAAKQKRPKRGS